MSRYINTLLLPLLLYSVSITIATIKFYYPDQIQHLMLAYPGALPSIIACAVVIFAVNQIFYVQRRYDRFITFGAQRRMLIKHFSDYTIVLYQSQGLAIRINVMMARRAWFAAIEGPWGKKVVRPWKKVFKMLWASDNMAVSPDRYIELTTEQGVCGEAYRENQIRYVELSAENRSEYDLSSRQLDATLLVKCILSVPIRMMNHRRNELMNTVIGVVNVDSTDGNLAAQIKANPKILVELTERTNLLSVVCSRMY